MRMWNVDPKLMCRKHLLGEHAEMHMAIGSILKKKSIAGFINKGLLEPEKIQERHNYIADEMIRRGMKHNSPLYTNIAIWFGYKGKVNSEANLVELSRRCPECRKLIEKC